METTSNSLLTANTFLKHWQGHRRLTRRTIDAFPEDQLFQFSLGGMRTFGEMACELLGLAVPIVRGFATGEWVEFKEKPTEKTELLRLWDEQTAQLEDIFLKIPPHRFQETETMFGRWEATGWGGMQYAIDNEIHHRGEGFVYLRALGIEPPPFWDRN